jgi:hypothetical protein
VVSTWGWINMCTVHLHTHGWQLQCNAGADGGEAAVTSAVWQAYAIKQHAAAVVKTG